eukprot:scaffold3480_cov2376-Pavlova_lutheri.AAC.1
MTICVLRSNPSRCRSPPSKSLLGRYSCFGRKLTAIDLRGDLPETFRSRHRYPFDSDIPSPRPSKPKERDPGPDPPDLREIDPSLRYRGDNPSWVDLPEIARESRHSRRGGSVLSERFSEGVSLGYSQVTQGDTQRERKRRRRETDQRRTQPDERVDGRSGGAREAKEEKPRSVWEEEKRKEGGGSEAPSLSQRSKGRVDRSSREGGQNDAAEGRVLVQSDSELRGGSDGTVPGHRRRKMQPDAGGLDASKEAAEAGRCRGAGAAAFQ